MAEHRTQHKAAPGGQGRRPFDGFRRIWKGALSNRATASLSGVGKEHAAPFASDPVTRADGPPCTRFTRDSRTT